MRQIIPLSVKGIATQVQQYQIHTRLYSKCCALDRTVEGGLVCTWEHPLKRAIATSSLFLLLFLLPLPSGAQNPPSNPDPSAKQLEVNWIYGAYVAKDVPLTPLATKQRWQLYARQTYTTPGIYLKTVLFSVGDHISDSPREWEGDWGGFARRVGSRHGQFVIQNSISTLSNAALGYEPRYDRCRCAEF